MYITRIQGTTPLNSTIKSTTKTKIQNCGGLYNNSDRFEKRVQPQEIFFSGRANIFEKMMQRYLENKSYKNSIFGSKRPYLSLSEDLKPFTKEAKIVLPNKEEIGALDINRNNSKDYILFLHGFSQNINDNQPLYREISKSKFGILAPEYRGYGKNKLTKNYRENNIMQDIQASLNYLKENGKQCKGIIGHSFGAYISARVAKDIKPDFLVMVSPMISLEFWLKNVIKHPKKYKFEYGLNKYIEGFSKQYHKVFDIRKHLKNNPTNTYIIQANNDKYVRTCKVNEITPYIMNLKKFTKIKTGGHKMDNEKIAEIKKIVDKL